MNISTVLFDKSPHGTTMAENYTGADKVGTQDTWVIQRTCKIILDNKHTDKLHWFVNLI